MLQNICISIFQSNNLVADAPEGGRHVSKERSSAQFLTPLILFNGDLTAI